MTRQPLYANVERTAAGHFRRVSAMTTDRERLVKPRAYDRARGKAVREMVVATKIESEVHK